jgi:membrane fusion protein (multidrug efflux system)
MKSKKGVISVLVVVVILALLALPKLDFSSDSKDDGNSSRLRSTSLTVEGKIMKPVSLQNKIVSNGTLLGNEEVELRSETSGKVTEILFEEGRSVKKGALLLKINDADLQATLKKNIIRRDFAKDKEYRLQELLKRNLTSQQDYDVVLNDLNAINVDIEYTNALIAKTEIHAPFDGIIGLRSVSIGSYISPQNFVATLQSINPIKIDFAVPQKYYNFVASGREIEFRLPSTDKVFTGKIYAVEPKIDETTRTIMVRAIAPNNQGLLSPGAYVEIEIVLANLTDALLVPTEAIVPDIQGEKVFLYKSGKSVPQLVKTGIRTEEEIQILSGIEIGDTVIVSGIIQLRPNSSVTISTVK